MNIWQSLPKPFFVLAPMEDVTDTVFRQIIKNTYPPDLFFTEFTNVEGMASAGDKIVTQRLRFTRQEKPLIAQIWGKKPEHFLQAAKRIVALGFDGIDINMGCPEKSIVKNGCCAALINNPSLAHEIIEATKEGAGTLPVSVKTRIGYSSVVIETWIPFLLSHNLAALTIHGRTAQEMSQVPCHWDRIGECVNLRNSLNPQTLIIGNGDILSKKQGMENIDLYGVDGIMIGRGIFADPYIFSGNSTWSEASVEQKITLLQTHVELYKSTWGTTKPANILKKYIKIYIQGFEGASELRATLMETTTLDDLLEALANLQKS